MSDFVKIMDAMASAHTVFLASVLGNKLPITETKYQWEEDQFHEPQLNAQIEGFTPMPTASSPCAERTNYTQIIAKTASVDVNDPFFEKSMVHIFQKRCKGALLDLEYSLIGSRQTMQKGNGISPALMAGVQAQIDPSMIYGTLTESRLISALRDLFLAGARPTTLLYGPFDAEKIDEMDCLSKPCPRCTDDRAWRLETSFGDIEPVFSPFIAPHDAILYNPDDFELLVFDDWRTYELAGYDGQPYQIGELMVEPTTRSKMVVGEFSLKLANSRAAALFGR